MREGVIRLHRDGYGFVVAEKEGDEDVFVPANAVGDALHTDRVCVEVVKSRRGFEGRVVNVIERRVKTLVGRLEQIGKHFQVIVDDRRVRHRVLVSPKKLAGARHGQNVVVSVLEYPRNGSPMQGEVSETLGIRGEQATERTAVIIRHQLPRAFPQNVLNAARRLQMTSSDLEHREDLRHLPFVTIDGESARDFDDAVTAERMDDGTIRLWVAIADVSHFVRPGDAIDHEALSRGTSVYFPEMCLPMLPEELSNDLCSLIPDVDRLALAARLDFDESGNVCKTFFTPCVIKSHRRMTYTEVKRIILEKDPDATKALGNLLPKLELMKECFDRLRKKRIERGSIDFDLPEPEIVLDMQGEVESIVKSERHVGHMMIEEFMVAANEAVATFLTQAGQGCIYRVHESPNATKIHAFSVLIHNLGHQIYLGKNPSPGLLAKVVKRVHGKPEERLVNHQLLRSMARAVYSHRNKGHYGLASNCYCHFTSPIRRYPDLVIHRLLKAVLKRASSKTSFHLSEIAEHSSQREKIAMEAEREMAKLVATLFMQRHVGSAFSGIVSHVAKFGIFVELIDYFIEGVIPLASLEDDFYELDERGFVVRGKKTKKTFTIGDSIQIVVADVDIPNREIVFSPASSNR